MKYQRMFISQMNPIALSLTENGLQTNVSERPIRVMSVGDSITEGSSSANYRENLLTLVNNGEKTIDFVGHNVKKFPEDGEQSGEGGWRADQIAGTAPPPIYESSNIGNVQTWIPAYQPDIILLMAGKNDILQGRGTAGTTANIEELIDKAFEAKPSVRIIVGLITPSRNNASYSGTHVAINNNIKSIVATLSAEGKDITWVDTYGALNGGDSALFGDSVHPNQTGYDRIAESFYDGLRTHLNNASYIQQQGEVIGGGLNDSSKPFVNAFDDNTSSSASLKSSGWVGLDLGEERQIYNIRVRHSSSYTRKLLIQGSNSSDFSSGVSKLVSIPKAEANRWMERSILNPEMYRYVRVKPNDGNGVGIREFEIFSVDNSKSSVSELNLQPVHDAFVRGGVFANRNYGAASLLRTKESSSNYDRQSYLQFDVGAVSNAVSRATLTLDIARASGAATAKIFQVATDSWTENGLKWKNKPGTNGLIDSIGINSDTTSVTFDVTDYVNEQAGGDGVISFQLAINKNVNINFRSRESAMPPVLSVTSSSSGIAPLKIVATDDAQVRAEASAAKQASRIDERLVGTSDADTLNGQDGNETLRGFQSNDTLIVGRSNDRLSGNQGDDWLISNSGRDLLVGNSGGDRLISGHGFDSLIDGAGADEFIFHSIHHKADQILNFNPEEDNILISKTGFNLDISEGQLNKSRFAIDSGANNMGDRFIYNSQTGALIFAPDGIRQNDAEIVTVLSQNLNLNASNIRII